MSGGHLPLDKNRAKAWETSPVLPIENIALCDLKLSIPQSQRHAETRTFNPPGLEDHLPGESQPTSTKESSSTNRPPRFEELCPWQSAPGPMVGSPFQFPNLSPHNELLHKTTIETLSPLLPENRFIKRVLRKWWPEHLKPGIWRWLDLEGNIKIEEVTIPEGEQKGLKVPAGTIVVTTSLDIKVIREVGESQVVLGEWGKAEFGGLNVSIDK